MDFLEILTRPIMWIVVIPGISIVVIQAIVFGRKAYAAGLEIGLTKEQLKSSIRSSAIASIGPAVVVLTGMIALLAMVGGAMAWQRGSVIGNVVFEMLAFNFGVEATATPAGVEGITMNAAINGLWVMVLGATPWILVSVLFTDKMDLLQNKVSGGDPTKMRIIGTSAMVSGMATLASGHVVVDVTSNNAVAVYVGTAVMIVICIINSRREKPIKWLTEWALAICLLLGVLVTAAYAGLF
jgi:hypothetical protein